MTYFEAALQVLRRSKRPLTTAEILDRILAESLVRPRGKTPHQTLSAELYKNAGNESGLVKLSESGPTRARHGSVRWTVSSTTATPRR
jgi:hypothetical protein